VRLGKIDSLTRKAAVDDVLTSTLKTVFAVAESYPDLKANENFLQLQKKDYRLGK